MADILDSIRGAFTPDDNIREFKSEDNGDTPLFLKAALTAAVGTATLVGLGRTGALRHLSEEGSLLGRTLRDASTKFNNEAPIVARLLKETPSDLVSNFRSHWDEALTSNRKLMDNNQLFNGATYAERAVENADRLERGLKTQLNKERLVGGILRPYKQEFESTEQYLRVHNYVSKNYSDKASNVDEFAAKLQENFGLDENLSSKISQQTKAYVDQNIDLVSEKELKTVKNAAHNSMVQEFANILGTTDDGEKSLFTGYKRATLEDLLKADADKKIELGDKQKKFFQEVIDKAVDSEGNNIGSKIIADKHVYKDADGNLIDMRTIPGAARQTADDFSDALPAKIFHIRDILNKKDERMFQYFGKGTSAPTISHLTNAEKDNYFLENPLLQLGKHIYDVEGKNLDPSHQYRLISSEYGTIPRAIKKMFGMSIDRDRNRILGVIPKDKITNPHLKKFIDYLDIGHQEGASTLEEVIGLFAKKHNPDWDRNVIERITKGEGKKKDFESLSFFFDRHVNALSGRTWDKVLGHLQSSQTGYAAVDISKLSMRNHGEIEKALEFFQHHQNARNIQSDRLSWILRQYGEDPHGFLNRNISVSNKVDLPFMKRISKLTGYDIAKREIQKEVMLQSGLNYFDLFKSFSKNLKITGQEARSASHLAAYADFEHLIAGYKTTDPELRAETTKLLNGYFSKAHKNGNPRESLEQLKRTYASVFQSISFNDGKTDKINTKFMSFRDDSNFLGIKKGAVKKSLRQLRSINDATKARAAAKDFGGGMYNFFREISAGRKRPQDVTATTITSHFFFERLNEHLSKAGIGLSDKSLGSAGQIAMSLMTKRVMPIIFGINAVNYLDYRAETYTGTGLYAGAYKTWANTNVGIHKIFDATGVASAYKTLYDIMPQLQYLDENGPMSAEERKNHYLNGYDPVRRGRFWGLSSTPFHGDSVEYYRPTNYRLVTSNYKYTDTLYGSKDEYWANSWLPTPAHPFAPIRHFITDRYHWENKHYKDRPYPYSSPLFEDGTPWGAILNPTIGQIVKPIKRMHASEFDRSVDSTGTRIVNQINKFIKNKASAYERSKTSKPVSVDMAMSDSQSGVVGKRFVADAFAEPGSYIQTYNYTEDGYTPDNGVPTLMSGGGIKAVNTQSGSVTVSPAGVNSLAIISQINNSIKSYAGIAGPGSAYRPKYGKVHADGRKDSYGGYGAGTGSSGGIGYGGGVGAGSGSSLPSVNGTFLSPSIYQSMKSTRLDRLEASELYAPNSLKAANGDLAMSFKDISGIWGFFYNTATETGVTGRSKRIANAGSMTSMSRSFWDQAWGGLGDSLSEIGRRFIPRPNRDGEAYNPLRNTMPTWLPEKYRTGDPYTKLKKGEARLPGAGYESLNRLHPDKFGTYGAFDRFKILADIAPYSEEYRLWKSIAERNASDELKPEMKEIKHRVSIQNQQHRFFSYKFKYSDTTKSTVTVAKILDKNTFVSHEMGDTPIRLAGVKLTTPNGLSDMIRTGQALTIEYAKDKNRRKNADTYGTLNAVLYSNGVNLNRRALEDGLAKKRNDDSPAGIHALYSSTGIFWGKTFESIAHLDILPNNKFLRVRSPYEEYNRTEVYGKPYTSWMHPIDSYVTPTIERAFSKGILGGALKLGTFGAILGMSGLGGSGHRIRNLAAFGAVVGAVGGLKTDLIRLTGGEYIPNRVKKRREIDEYFDKLKYIKYKRLYEQAKSLAFKREHTNIEAELDAIENGKVSKSLKKRALQTLKQKAYLYSGSSGVRGNETIKKKNEEMNTLTAQKVARRAGKYTMAALLYREQMKATLTGLDEKSPWISAIRALPRRDKEYFAEFINAPEEERKKILRILPKQQAAILRRVWKTNSKEDNPLVSFFKNNLSKEESWFISKVKSIVKPHIQNAKGVNERIMKDLELNQYFSKHALPGKKWVGWRPDMNLDAIKVKTLHHYGIDVSDDGFTQQDLQDARIASPPAFDIHKHSPSIMSSISSVLSGGGLTDVQVMAVPMNQSGLSVKVNMMFDKAKSIGETIQSILN